MSSVGAGFKPVPTRQQHLHRGFFKKLTCCRCEIFCANTVHGFPVSDALKKTKGIVGIA